MPGNDPRSAPSVKTWSPTDVTVKGARVRAAFGVIGNLDRDGDVLCAGAIREGITVPVGTFNHGSLTAGQLPVGRGKVTTDGGNVVVDAKFFQTQQARDTAHVLEQLGEDGKWSFTYSVRESDYGPYKGKRVQFLRKLDLYEVSAVLIPATRLRTPSTSLATMMRRQTTLWSWHNGCAKRSSYSRRSTANTRGSFNGNLADRQ